MACGQLRTGWGFNPRSPRGGATGQQYTVRVSARDVSIHAPHEGERPILHPWTLRASKFQSTLPTRGSDVICHHKKYITPWFQSTLPTRGSDHVDKGNNDALIGFNPRSPRGGATFEVEYKYLQANVSIHAPHEGERHDTFKQYLDVLQFQSTLPTRGSDL